jgi:excisionase family DNA binding protein
MPGGRPDLVRAGDHLTASADATAAVVADPRVLALGGPGLVDLLSVSVREMAAAGAALRAAGQAGPYMLSVEDVADALSIGRTSAWRLVRDGAIRSTLVGRRRLVSSDALAEYVAAVDGASA